MWGNTSRCGILDHITKTSMMSMMLVKFIDIYKTCCVGVSSDRYAQLQIRWQVWISHFLIEGSEENEFLSTMLKQDVNRNDKSTVIHNACPTIISLPRTYSYIYFGTSTETRGATQNISHGQ